MCSNKSYVGFINSKDFDKKKEEGLFTHSTKVLATDTIGGLEGFLIIISDKELEQYNSYNCVTDNGGIVKVIFF